MTEIKIRKSRSKSEPKHEPLSEVSSVSVSIPVALSLRKQIKKAAQVCADMLKNAKKEDGAIMQFHSLVGSSREIQYVLDPGRWAITAKEDMFKSPFKELDGRVHRRYY